MVEGEGFALKLDDGGKGSDVDGEWRAEVRTRRNHTCQVQGASQCIRDKTNKNLSLLYYCNTGTKGERGGSTSKASTGMYVGYDTLVQVQGTKW